MSGHNEWERKDKIGTDWGKEKVKKISIERGHENKNDTVKEKIRGQRENWTKRKLKRKKSRTWIPI